jgi:hypothetical protein
VLGTVLFTGTQVSLEQRLNELSVPASQISIVTNSVVESAGSAIPGLEAGLIASQVEPALAAEIREAAGDAFTDGAKWSAWAAAGFLALGFLSTFNLGSRKERCNTANQTPVVC